ncbi:hypothetical protein D3C86_1937030 [compost metagenome]
MQPVGEKIRRGREFLLLIVILSRELFFVDVMGQALAGLVDARGAGAQHHTNAVVAVGLDCAVDLRADLQRGLQQQLIVAAAMQRHVVWNCHQFASDRTDRQ